jgi:hypothetical protein
MTNIIIKQAMLFNNNLSDSAINYLVSNNLFLYSSINEVVLYQNNELNFNIEDIEWLYDENNYRIPYINKNKIYIIKLTSSNNIYDFVSSSCLVDNNNIICGENFVKICDVFIGSINSINANTNNTYLQKNIVNIENNLVDVIEKNKTIFVKTDDLYNFFIKTIDINLQNNIIITHNSDHGIDTMYIPFLNKVNKQYSQNCLIQHTNLLPIPIGIENSQWFDHNILHKIRNRTDIKKKKIYIFYVFINNTSI